MPAGHPKDAPWADHPWTEASSVKSLVNMTMHDKKRFVPNTRPAERTLGNHLVQTVSLCVVCWTNLATRCVYAPLSAMVFLLGMSVPESLLKVSTLLLTCD